MRVINFLKRTAALIIIALCITVAAEAQHEPSGPMDSDRAPEVWSKHLGTQLALSLASPITEIKIIALENTAFFASRRNTILNLKPTIPVLAKIYRYDPEERFRLLATADLHYIGNFESMMALRDGLRFQRSKAVQWVAVGALLDYFGPKAFTKDKEMMELAESLVRYYRTRPLPIPEEKVPEPTIAVRENSK